MPRRVLTVIAALTLSFAAGVPADAAGGRGGGGGGGGVHRGGGHGGGGHHGHGGWSRHHGHHHGGCCWGWGAGFAWDAAFAYPWYAYPRATYPYGYAYPYYGYSVPYPNLEYVSQGTAAQADRATQTPVAVQREVVYPHGKYLLFGDGVTAAWQWVWVPAVPSPEEK